MSPRKIPALPTREDRLIWLNINLPLLRPHSQRMFCSAAYMEADRRDAHLMFTAQILARHGPAAIELFGIHCRGWSQE